MQDLALLLGRAQQVEQVAHQPPCHSVAGSAFNARLSRRIDEFEHALAITLLCANRLKRNRVNARVDRAAPLIEPHAVAQALELSADLPCRMRPESGLVGVETGQRAVQANRRSLFGILAKVVEPILPDQPGDAR